MSLFTTAGQTERVAFGSQPKTRFRFLSGAFCLLLTFTLLFTVEEAEAQTRISGTVMDSRTQEPLPGATVLQANTTNGTSTNDSGYFELTLRPNDARRIEVSYVGYQSRELRIRSGQTSDLSIYLDFDAFLSDDVIVSGLRVDESTPMSFTNVTREEIEEGNLGQDLPFLLQMAPSVLSTSDAGAGIGYTGIRIRGVDPTRINVTVNGIPLNDSESHGVFWVNMPDFASSIENLQIQRGVGTSTNGQAAFGASVNIQTGSLNQNPYATVTNAVGSYNTRRHNILAGTGLLDNGWSFDARLSKIESDGYIDRAFSDLSSYALTGSRYGERSLLKINVLSGREQTYQAWNGVPESELENNRRMNEFTYDNQTDNYRQDHYQLHYSYRLTDIWLANASLHYTYGRGYFEEFRANDRLSSYQIDPIIIGDEIIDRSDIIRRRWLDNHFYGFVASTEWNQDRFSLVAGGGYNEYDGDHFGEVIWARFAGDSDIRERYYDNNGFKTDGNVYAKLSYNLTDQFTVYGDAQVRRIYYRFLGFDRDLSNVTQDDELWFFNPKAGLVYRFGAQLNQRLYTSFSVAGKEPTRREYTRSTPDSRPNKETLYNLEAGYRGEFGRGFFGANLYYMLYDDQLILTGEINDVGQAIRTNVPDSYRAGVELEGGYRFLPWLEWSGNVTFSQNKIDEYTEFIDNFDTGIQESVIYENTDIALSPNVISASQFRFSHRGFSADLMSQFVSRQYLDNTSSRDRSIDPYFVTDLRLSYTTTRIPLVKSMTSSFQINNVFNELYETNGYTFGFVSGGEMQRFNYYYPQAERNVLAQVTLNF
ncbi:MAG: TonB-dependent receptor [Balneolia bacterium]|nr:TonB-dependent receptor [Balneolia bacterium]